MRTYTIPHWMQISTPPEEQGQIVQSSYGIDLATGIALRRTIDQSDRTEEWAICDLTDAELEDLDGWVAHGGAPIVSGEWEPCEVQ